LSGGEGVRLIGSGTTLTDRAGHFREVHRLALLLNPTSVDDHDAREFTFDFDFDFEFEFEGPASLTGTAAT
jgi:hypothetical protein